jgi:hypothetical protein
VINNKKYFKKMNALDNGNCSSARAQKYEITDVVIITCKITEESWSFLMVGL